MHVFEDFTLMNSHITDFKIKYGDQLLKHLIPNIKKKRINTIYNEYMKIIKNHLKNTKYDCTTADV